MNSARAPGQRRCRITIDLVKEDVSDPPGRRARPPGQSASSRMATP